MSLKSLANNDVGLARQIGRAKQTLSLDDDVSVLVGKNTKRYIGLKRLQINTVRDLLNFYPFRYNDFTQVVAVNEVMLGETATVLGTIKDVQIKRPKPKMVILEVTIIDNSAVMIASWFNQPWLESLMQIGKRIILKGKMEHNYGFYRMVAPLHSILEDGEVAGGIMPVYHSNSEISQGWVSHIISDALSKYCAVLDPLPVEMRIANNLVSRQSAIRNIHQPKSSSQLALAKQRLAFEEILLLQLYMNRKRHSLEQNDKATAHTIDGRAQKMIRQLLTFDLTQDQERCVAEILADMATPKVMNRLLLGDVGSGKTIVAAFALTAAIDSKSQAVMMAPTEVLAMQYSTKLGPLFDQMGITWAHLSSAATVKQRAELLQALSKGETSVLFATHAAIEDDVVFANLSLAIIDEQHRFGVAQRRKLLQKGSGVDYLSMTATPIPRSLALTIYGDMNTSYIRQKPNRHTAVQTHVISRSDIRFAYAAVADCLKRGEQAYIVCPLIGVQPTGAMSSKNSTDNPDEEQSIELFTEFSSEDDGESLKAAEVEVKYLQDVVFPQNKIALMTSKLKPAVKRQVMEDFRQGNIDVLVSTTVIEVGVDVANATVMIIQDAERFGLSQLHQLRGRVGRGGKNSSVYLVSTSQNEKAIARLQALEKSSDGFELAAYDLLQRREGDILGSRQSGKQILKLINVIRDSELINKAHELALSLLDQDPKLNDVEHLHLKHEIDAVFGSEGFADDVTYDPNATAATSFVDDKSVHA